MVKHMLIYDDFTMNENIFLKTTSKIEIVDRLYLTYFFIKSLLYWSKRLVIVLL